MEADIMDPSSTIESLEGYLEFKNKKVEVEISITERGEIKIETLDSTKFIINNLNDFYPKHMKTMTGETKDGSQVQLSNVDIEFSSNLSNGHSYISKVKKPTQVEIDQTYDFESDEGEKVTIKFDVCCLKHFHHHNVQRNITLLTRPNWKAIASPLSDLNDRIDFIKSYKIPLRTIEIYITQDIPGTVDHQVNEAEKKLQKILELSGFVQGVSPGYIRAELESIDDEPESINNGMEYKKYYLTDRPVGGCFKSGTLVWGDEFQKYLDVAYENYDSEVREDLRLREVLEYYWGALDNEKFLEERFLNICSAIELLGSEKNDNKRTREKIEELVKRLDVKTEDLAKVSGTYDENKNSSKIYFYRDSRCYVVHENVEGSDNPTWEERRDDFIAALTLLKRVIRNQLIGPNNIDEFDTLSEITPNEIISYE